jgi:hypothetical protein
MVPLTFIGLDNLCQVIHVQPHTLFVNRLGRRLSLRQCDQEHVELFYPNDPPKAILWQSTDEPELLKVEPECHVLCFANILCLTLLATVVKYPYFSIHY